jgi:hypothetical protein
MSERYIPENFGSELLRQDELLDSERYKEHRMQLEHQLARAESRERLTKHVVVVAILVAASAFFILAARGFRGAVPFDKDATAFTIAVGVAYTIAWLVFFVGVVSNLLRFLPRVRRAREELREETIRELRREVADLRQLVQGKAKARETDQGGTE